MDALKDAVASAFEKVVASGAIEEALETHIAKAVTSAIAEQFAKEWHQPVSFEKILAEHLHQSLLWYECGKCGEDECALWAFAAPANRLLVLDREILVAA